MSSPIPVITIDGPTASGKGTVATRVATALGWHVLDSGALYRLCALALLQKSIDENNETLVLELAQGLEIQFKDDAVFLAQQNVSELIRSEQVGNIASKIAAYPSLREVLLEKQRDFQKPPGLVADGRDMGTIVFPNARLKVFLQASPEARAERRYKQLKEKGISVNLESISQDLRARDLRDTSRAVAPLVAAQDAFILDSSFLSIEEVVNQVLSWYKNLS